MSENFKLVRINSDYCNYLRNYDYRVMYNSSEKEMRPFVGVLFEVNDFKYFAPLASPKPKHLKMKNSIDFYKINSGKLGAINLNNMIPVVENLITYIDLDKECITNQEEKYQKMMKVQIYWLNRHDNTLKDKASELYERYMTGNLKPNIIMRCCDFRILEEKCIEYSRIRTLFPDLQYITNIEDLYYIYDYLNNQDEFEKIVQLLDTPQKCATIQNMSKDEINSVLTRQIDDKTYKNEDIDFFLDTKEDPYN